MRGATRLAVWAAVLAAGCLDESSTSHRGPDGATPGELRIVSFTQQGKRDVGRNEPLVLRFSAPLDPASVGAGSIRVVGRRGSREQPVTVEVRGTEVLLTPPSPFGFDPRTRYWVVVEGFPSLRAPRSLSATPLARRFRASFTTSRSYAPDLVPPVTRSVELVEEPTRSLFVEFSEPVDPRSVELGVTLLITSLDDGSEIPGRLIPDRRAELFRFLPTGIGRHTGIKVELGSGIMDLSGNPLRVPPEGREERIVYFSPSSRTPGVGEIVEDFTTRRMMDPGETTALWDDPASPGVLSGDRQTTHLEFEGDPRFPETFFPIGGEEIVFRLLLGPEQLGPPRELTGLALYLAAAGQGQLDQREIRVEITPTRRQRIDQRDADSGPPIVVCDEARFRVEPENRERLAVPFTSFYSYSGESSLFLEIRLGPGRHTSFLRARRSRPGSAVVLREGKAEPLRPLLSLQSFSLVPTGTSRFYDTGDETPEYREPVLHPAGMPPDVRLEILFQGASSLGRDGRPGDPEALSGWVEDVRLLAGYRYIRFRATFRGVNLTGAPPVLDDLVIPWGQARQK